MISLDFDLNELHNQIDVHNMDENVIIVAHNGYSYTRIMLNPESIEKLISKLQKQVKHESESLEFDSTNKAEEISL